MSTNPETLSLKTIINEFDLLKKKFIIQWNLWDKDLLFLATKLIEKISDPCNADEHYQSFVRKKTKKSEIITYQPKNSENGNTVVIK